MMVEYALTKYIGNTPVVRLKNVVSKNHANVFVKLEEFNPGGSIKTRVAWQMIKDAEESGLLIRGSGQELIEPTGGNTGIGLTIIGNILGYKTTLVIPDNYSKDRINLLKLYGAKVILSDSKLGNDSHIRKAKDMLINNDYFICLDQFSNMSSVTAHYNGTANELIKNIGTIDAFVSVVGSGGTITGVGKKLKETGKVAIYGVQPDGCDIIKGKAIPHKIQGTALGIYPKIFDSRVIDDVITVNFQQVKNLIRKLACKEGIFVGLSSGANILASIEVARHLGKGSKVVTMAPDSGRSYIDELNQSN